MPNTKMGFEGKIFYGPAGTTAPTEIENSRDITYDFGADKGDTSSRGDGSVPPITTERVAARNITIEWQMLNKANDTTLSALLEAAYLGDPVALRTLAHASGKGYDGDVTLTVRHGKPIRGEQTYDFTATPNDDSRTPLLYV